MILLYALKLKSINVLFVWEGCTFIKCTEQIKQGISGHVMIAVRRDFSKINWIFEYPSAQSITSITGESRAY